MQIKDIQKHKPERPLAVKKYPIQLMIYINDEIQEMLQQDIERTGNSNNNSYIRSLIINNHKKLNESN